MKALLITATVSALVLAACSKQEETPAQAPAVEQSKMETLENTTTENTTPAQEPMYGLTAGKEEVEQKEEQSKMENEAATPTAQEGQAVKY